MWKASRVGLLVLCGAVALLAADGSHAGVVFTTEKRWPRTDPGALITALDELLASTPEQPVDAELWL